MFSLYILFTFILTFVVKGIYIGDGSFKTLSSLPSPLDITSREFVQISSRMRDYTFVVLFTEDDNSSTCKTCVQINGVWKSMVKSWRETDPKSLSRIVFAVLRRKRGEEIFQKLQVSTVPNVVVFPATEGPMKSPDITPFRIDLSDRINTAAKLAQIISEAIPNSQHPIHARVVKPIGMIPFAVSIGLCVALTIFFRSHFITMVRSNTLWKFLTYFMILIFIGGFMFSVIRKVPYMTVNNKNELVYISSGFQNQIGIESQIISILYALLSMAFLYLCRANLNASASSNSNVYLIIVTIAIYLAHSLLVSFFSRKSSGYPFLFPPF